MVDDDIVVTKSIVINEYLDDAFPRHPLKPNDPAGRAKMRWWTKQIDDGIFAATGTVSMSIAFHHQYTPEVLEELTRQRGEAYRKRFNLLQQGVNNPNFPDAIKRLYKMVVDMSAALERGPWLCGEMLTLADVAFAPYLTRLDQLKFVGFLDKTPAHRALVRADAQPRDLSHRARGAVQSEIPAADGGEGARGLAARQRAGGIGLT